MIEERISCGDGNCIGGIGLNDLCVVCGKMLDCKSIIN
jgi:hypothetical protein